MNHALISIILAAAMVVSPSVLARGSSGSTSHTGSSHSGVSHPSSSSHTTTGKSAAHANPSRANAKKSAAGSPPSGTHKSNYAQSVQRNSKGKIARSAKAKDDFKKQHP